MHKAWRTTEYVPYCFSRSSVKFQGRTGQTKLPILTRIECFRTVTPVWIYWWLWTDAQSLKNHRIHALLFFKVIRQISRSHGTNKIADFDPNWAFPDCNSSSKRCPEIYQGHPSNFKVTRDKKRWFWQELSIGLISYRGLISYHIIYHIISHIISYVGLYVFSLAISLVMIERIYIHVRCHHHHYHHQIGSMN